MRDPQAAPAFEEFVLARSGVLLRAGWLLTGDESLAHDLVQAALLRTWQRWGRLRDPQAAEAYVRRVMVTTLITWRRRRSFGERPVADVPDAASAPEDLDTRRQVALALRALPPRQRAVVVLRHFLDLSEADTAAALGCSVGTVKSQNARALKALRDDPILRDEFSSEVTS